MSSLAIVNSSAPFSSGSSQESLDLAMVAGSFGQQVALFFVHDGVFQLLPHQQGQHLDRKNLLKQFGALEFYDIEQLFVCAQSLRQRHINSEDLPAQLTLTLLESEDFSQQLANFNHVLRF